MNAADVAASNENASAGKILAHPVANIFPRMPDSEYRALVADIAANGLRELIWCHRDGRVIDGRHRAQAVAELGGDAFLTARTYEGDDASIAAFVVSLNLRRRHLDATQRSMVAARLAPAQRGRHTSIDVRSQPQAAELLNVSVPSVQRASVVLAKGAEELIAACDAGPSADGGLAVSDAASIAASKTHDEQRALLTARASKGAARALQEQSNSSEWYTPARYVESARAVLGAIDLDPASSPEANVTVRAKVFYAQADDGLAREWSGTVWLNPPYGGGQVAAFISRLLDGYERGSVTAAIALVNSHPTETRWFQRCFAAGSAVCFTDHRIAFEHPERASAAPPNGSAFVYLGADAPAFERAFQQYGAVVVGAAIASTGAA